MLFTNQYHTKCFITASLVQVFENKGYKTLFLKLSEGFLQNTMQTTLLRNSESSPDFWQQDFRPNGFRTSRYMYEYYYHQYTSDLCAFRKCTKMEWKSFLCLWMRFKQNNGLKTLDKKFHFLYIQQETFLYKISSSERGGQDNEYVPLLKQDVTSL